MADVRIKLSADSSQVRREVKLIDQEMRKLGSGSSKQSSRVDRDSRVESVAADSHGNDKLLSDIHRQLAILNRELQKITSASNSSLASSPTNASNPGNSASPMTAGGGGGLLGALRSNLSIGNTGSGNGSGSGIGGVVSAGVALSAANRAKNYLQSGARSSAAGELQAYGVFNTTGAYKDYYSAKEDATNVGKPLGYDYNTVLAAAHANLSTGGWTSKENYNSDITALTQASRAWGIDPTSMAASAGHSTALGITRSGDQNTFASLLGESIVENGMQGRENEQLQVLNTISDNLAAVNVSVSDQSLKGSLGMYNAAVSDNPAMKGQRGAEMVTSMQGIADQGDSTLDVLAGYGTRYTGVAGKLALRRMAETNPEQYYKQVMEGARAAGIPEENLELMMYSKSGSANKAGEMVNIMHHLENGDVSAYNDLSAGEGQEQQNLQNWNGSDVKTQQEYGISKQDTQEGMGEQYNNLANPLRGLYSGMDGTGRGIVDTIGGIAQTGILLAGGKAIVSKLFGGAASGGGGGILSTILGKVGASGAGEGGILSSILGKAGGAAKGASGGLDDLISGISKGVSGSADDIAAGVSKGVSGASEGAEGASGALSGASKAIGAIGLGLGALMTIADVKGHLDQGDNRGAAGAAGGGIGGMVAGAAAGAAGGAALGSVVPGIGNLIGGVVGGVGGAIVGSGVGQQFATNVYDISQGNGTESQFQDVGSTAMVALTGLAGAPLGKLIGTAGYKSVQGEPDKETDDNTNALKSLTDIIKSFLSTVFGIKFSDNDNSDTDKKQAKDSAGNSTQGTGSGSTSQSSIGSAVGGTIGSAIDSIVSGIQKAWNSVFGGGNNDSSGGDAGTSHAVGAAYIPYDNYKASLHRGEMVLNRFDADAYRQGRSGNLSASGSMSLNINLGGSIPGMTDENQSAIANAVVQQINQTDLTKLLSNGFSRTPNY